MQRAEALAQEIRQAPLALAETLRAVDEGIGLPLDLPCSARPSDSPPLRTADKNEGTQAFLESARPFGRASESGPPPVILQMNEHSRLKDCGHGSAVGRGLTAATRKQAVAGVAQNAVNAEHKAQPRHERTASAPLWKAFRCPPEHVRGRAQPGAWANPFLSVGTTPSTCASPLPTPTQHDGQGSMLRPLPLAARRFSFARRPGAGPDCAACRRMALWPRDRRGRVAPCQPQRPRQSPPQRRSAIQQLNDSHRRRRVAQRRVFSPFEQPLAKLNF